MMLGEKVENFVVKREDDQFKRLNVIVIGAGYVGLCTGIVMAHIGHSVLCIDINTDKIALLEQGMAPIYEINLEAMLAGCRNNLSFTTELPKRLGDTDIVIIAVGTPSKENGDADMQYVDQVIIDITSKIEEAQDLIIVMKSTVPIGSNQEMFRRVNNLLSDRGVQANVNFVSNPEFLREGKAIYDSFYPDRIVVGGNNDSAIGAVKNMYYPLLNKTFIMPQYMDQNFESSLPSLVVTDFLTAEMIKYASNAFLATKVSFINEIAGLCDKVGADILDVSIGMGLDNRIGKGFLHAGLGWGGSCFPKDTLALQSIAREYDYEMPIIEAARTINTRQIIFVLRKIQGLLKVIRGKKIAVLGLSYKPGTDDIRDSVSVEIVKRIVRLGGSVSVYDPVALDNARKELASDSVNFCSSIICAIESADAVLIATEWQEFLEVDWREVKLKMRSPIIIDGRNLLHKKILSEMGFTYVGVGR
ncbi:UDP-glucose dehydrogenase family protein [Deinococcus altitudinis]|uniref:UDP-glucose dehydrogenase family protein n=1 Tax=Deinococcus altitudinis TaxID=468914 RepID=UPI0038914727